MAINTLKDLRRLHKDYDYIELIQFGTNCDIIFRHYGSMVWYKPKTIKELVACWRIAFGISRKTYIVLIVTDDMYERMQYYTHSFVYSVQELFRKEKVIVDKIRNDSIYNLFTS